MTTAVLYATACRSEFLSDPRVIIREIESLQAFAGRMGWDLVSGSNMDLPGVYYDPATSDKIQRPITRDGFREAFALSADTIVVQNSAGMLLHSPHWPKCSMTSERPANVWQSLRTSWCWIQTGRSEFARFFRFIGRHTAGDFGRREVPSNSPAVLRSRRAVSRLTR